VLEESGHFSVLDSGMVLRKEIRGKQQKVLEIPLEKYVKPLEVSLGQKGL
jgi:hypothetical protein